MCIQVKPEVASKATCVFVSIREKATQVKWVSKKSVSVLVKPSQVSERATVTSKLNVVNASTQTDDKIHVDCHDVASLTENMFQNVQTGNTVTQISLVTHFYLPRLMILLMNH